MVSVSGTGICITCCHDLSGCVLADRGGQVSGAGACSVPLKPPQCDVTNRGQQVGSINFPCPAWVLSKCWALGTATALPRYLEAIGGVPSLTLRLSQQHSSLLMLHALRMCILINSHVLCTVDVAAVQGMPTTGAISCRC